LPGSRLYSHRRREALNTTPQRAYDGKDRKPARRVWFPPRGFEAHFVINIFVEARLSTEELQRYLAVDLFFVPAHHSLVMKLFGAELLRWWLWIRDP